MIREEHPDDIKDIRQIHRQAFGQDMEADIVDTLRINCKDLLSLVAVEEGRLIGHSLFSPAWIRNPHDNIAGMGLAPMAVLPEWQRRGVGSRLVREGIERLAAGRCPFIIVLGHPDYYPRFGFQIASRFGIRCHWEGVPDEAFLILWLNPCLPERISGLAEFREEFNQAV